LTLVRGLRRLVEDMELYRDLMKSVDGEIRVAVVLTDTGEEASIILGETMDVVEDSDDADLRLTMESRVFDEVLRVKADFGALIGRSRMTDVRPINFQFLNPGRVSALTDSLKAMITFFTPGKVKVKELVGDLPEKPTAPTRSPWYTGTALGSPGTT